MTESEADALMAELEDEVWGLTPRSPCVGGPYDGELLRPYVNGDVWGRPGDRWLFADSTSPDIRALAERYSGNYWQEFDLTRTKSTGRCEFTWRWIPKGSDA